MTRTAVPREALVATLRAQASTLTALADALEHELVAGGDAVTIDQRDAAALAELRLTPRAYLEAARAGAFRSERRGRRVVARRADVETWRAAPRVVAAHPAALSVEDSVRAELGLVPKRPAANGGRR